MGRQGTTPGTDSGTRLATLAQDHCQKFSAYKEGHSSAICSTTRYQRCFGSKSFACMMSDAPQPGQITRQGWRSIPISARVGGSCLCSEQPAHDPHLVPCPCVVSTIPEDESLHIALLPRIRIQPWVWGTRNTLKGFPHTGCRSLCLRDNQPSLGCGQAREDRLLGQCVRLQHARHQDASHAGAPGGHGRP